MFKLFAPFALSLCVSAVLTSQPALLAARAPAPVETPAAGSSVYSSSSTPLALRVDDLFVRLTQDEKLSLLSDLGWETPPISRLDVPSLKMVYGPQGIAGTDGHLSDSATLFPAGVSLASAWDIALDRKIGAAIGSEALNKDEGAGMVLGPDVNIHRSPLDGRNGESMSEDPFLTAQTALAYIEGIQKDAKCLACIRNFACNNEENDRGWENSIVSQRALREIYLPAFETSVKTGDVGAVMAADNKINGLYATENKPLLTDILRDQWGFKGLVLSDDDSLHSTSAAISAGADFEMSGGKYFSPQKISDALAKGEITQAQIDRCVRDILTSIIRSGALDQPKKQESADVGSKEHTQLAYQAACEGIVLLRNEGNILPLDSKSIKSIALIGPAATDFQYGAVGSALVSPASHVSPLDAIVEKLDPSVDVRYAPGLDYRTPVPAYSLTTPAGTLGLHAEYFDNPDLKGDPVLVRDDSDVQFQWKRSPGQGVPDHDFSVRWTGKITAPESGLTVLSVYAGGGCRLWIDGKQVIDHWSPCYDQPASATIELKHDQSYVIRLEAVNRSADHAVVKLNWTIPAKSAIDEAAQAANGADVAIVFVGGLSTEQEGLDRDSLTLPYGQDVLIAAISAVNKHTIVVINDGAPVEIKPWIDGVQGIIDAGLPGEEGGKAISSILFGDVDPSGKLSDTFAVQRQDYPDYGNFHAIDGDLKYAEGIYVGYRGFEKKNIAPLYPFGFGLSYTSFKYSNLKLSSPTISGNGALTATADIQNAGRRDGAEVVELYVRPIDPKVDRPIRELKGFQRVELRPGETKKVTINLDARSFAYYDEQSSSWKVDDGDYAIELGASSADIRQTQTVKAQGVIAGN